MADFQKNGEIAQNGKSREVNGLDNHDDLEDNEGEFISDKLG